MDFSAAMFLPVGAGVDWPDGVKVTPLFVEEIVAGPR